MRPLICEYYSRIDQGDLDWVVSLFSQDAVYIRAELTFDGKEQIEAFYRTERKLKGTHSLNGLHDLDAGEGYLVRGRFLGHGKDGSLRDFGFCDVWLIRADLVVRRETYLALGAQYSCE